jgi:hypothetical protein
MFSVRPRPPAPLSSTRLGAYCGVAALGSGCEAEPKASRRRGAECEAFQGFLSISCDRSLLQSHRAKPYKADVGPIVGESRVASSHIGHVRVALPLSDVSRYRASPCMVQTNIKLARLG